MAKTAVIHARVQEGIKKQAENILKALGLTTTEAVNIFLYQVIINKGLPFEVKILNEETLKALQDSKENKNINSYNSFEELAEKLK
jgi:DNA-damage-inducible protein J